MARGRHRSTECSVGRALPCARGVVGCADSESWPEILLGLLECRHHCRVGTDHVGAPAPLVRGSSGVGRATCVAQTLILDDNSRDNCLPMNGTLRRQSALRLWPVNARWDEMSLWAY